MHSCVCVCNVSMCIRGYVCVSACACAFLVVYSAFLVIDVVDVSDDDECTLITKNSSCNIWSLL